MSDDLDQCKKEVEQNIDLVKNLVDQKGVRCNGFNDALISLCRARDNFKVAMRRLDDKVCEIYKNSGGC